MLRCSIRLAQDKAQHDSADLKSLNGKYTSHYAFAFEEELLVEDVPSSTATF